MAEADDLYSDALIFDVAAWANSEPINLGDLRGRVVMVEAFQMLCPGCVSRGIPQAQRVQRAFKPELVTVLGLHSVFEHHDVMTPVALDAFLHEYQITFPVAIDRPIENQRIPATMARYELQGTPTTLLVGRDGRIHHIFFGGVDDLQLGAILGRMSAA